MCVAWRVVFIVDALVNVACRVGCVARIAAAVCAFWRLGTIAVAIVAGVRIGGMRCIVGAAPSAAVNHAICIGPSATGVGRDADLALERQVEWRRELSMRSVRLVTICGIAMRGDGASAKVAVVAIRGQGAPGKVAGEGRVDGPGRRCGSRGGGCRRRHARSASADKGTATVRTHIPFCRVVGDAASGRCAAAY